MENKLITIDNTLYTPTQLTEYLKDVVNSEVPLLEKKQKINPVITRLQKFKREAKKSFEESIAPVTEVESYAKDLKKSVEKAIDVEWASVESRQKRLDILEEKFNLEAGTYGNAEKYADDPKLWTPSGNPKDIIRDMIEDHQRRENEMLKEQLAGKSDEQITELQDIPKEDGDHNGNLVDDARFIASKYGVKITHNPFKKQIVIDY